MIDHDADPDVARMNRRLTHPARRASSILKVVALVLAIGSIVGSSIDATTDLNPFYGGPDVEFPWRVQVMMFLRGVVPNLAYCALVFAAAYALELAAGHLARPGTAPAVPPTGDRPRPTVDPLDDSIWRP